MIPTALLTVLIAIVALALIVCAAIAIRLQLALRISSVTTCRGCGENLWGRPNAPICPTCGGDRRVPRTDRGADGGRSRIRRRRRALSVTALMILALSAVLAGVIDYNAEGSQLDPYKPTWLLINETFRTQDGGGASQSGDGNEALQELTSRIERLDSADMQKIVDRALDSREGNVAAESLDYQPWNRFIEAAHDRRRLQQAQWSRFLSQRFGQSIAAGFRQEIRRGDPLVVGVYSSRIVQTNRFKVSFEQSGPLMIAGRTVGMLKAFTPESERGMPPDPLLGRRLIDLPADLLASLSDGPQTATITVVMNVGDTQDRSGNPAYSETVTLQSEWTLLPESSSSLTVDASIQSKTLEQMAAATKVRILGKGNGLYIKAIYDPWVRYPFAYRIYLRHDGDETEVARGVSRTSQIEQIVDLPQKTAGLLTGSVTSHTTVDLIIRPNDDDAVRTLDCTRTWRGDIVVHDIMAE